MSQVIFVRSALGALVVAFAWAGASAALAADVTAPPPPPAYGAYGAAPVAVGMPGCETCQHGVAKASCSTCGKMFGKHLLHKDKNAPFPVTLCPGACFGYFQTQWRKWDEVCPYPYLGIGVNDAPRVPGTMPPPGTGLAPPRPLDPKMTDPKMPDPKKGGSDVPPTPPGGKFVP